MAMTMMQHDRGRDARVVQQYEVDTLGAPFKVTLWDCVSLSVDPKTGEEKVHIPDLVGLIKSVVRARVSHPRKLNGAELKFVRNALGVRANLLAGFLDMTPEHLSRCEAGSKVMSTMSEKVFRLLAFLGTFFSDAEEILLRSLNKEEIDKKAKKPNEMREKFAEQFLSMKIQSVFDSEEEELHFEFERTPVKETASRTKRTKLKLPSDEDTEWQEPQKQFAHA
jgi:DNA-binding transcriptional regulator YiaG